ncbi:hypothetical protein HN51_009858 [Arachis hypogaea]|uniref:C2H2-type domain-containing protein n=1 Tax=Arachis hypogaea TaxID=3818 RepID=A0A445E4U1_ARAHY|nr:protein SENSITIVE TO PROTON RHIZOTOXICITY 2-like [Arachis hypogaea]QHO54835.1 uncharacterized protein DS421_3g60250 [Arachis hypogaea]RYR70476.1 hypothetical protein Ahy_A03g016973 [Arachis hypogaea]
MAAASSDEGGGGFPPMTQYSSSSSSSSSSSTMYHYLSVLNDKINELQSLVGVIASPNRHHSSIPCSSYSMAISTKTSTIQDIILASSSFRLTFQQHINSYNNPSSSGTIIAPSCNNQQLELHPHHHHQSYDYNNSNIIRGGTSSVANHEPAQEEDEEDEETLHWFSEPYNNNNSTVIYCDDDNNNTKDEDGEEETDIIELDAADLLASYTHFCQICGKGFKREANLRMHMRAHGDEFKTSEALKNNKNNKKMMITKKKKYSCPEDGCRWNKNHAKFQALKSMVCVKNHYKRSHCPKMYVCKRCNNKNFSLLSDLRTHEKHCGDPNKWLCSCGTTFSRKDKLFGHLALFLGHSPVHAATQRS